MVGVEVPHVVSTFLQMNIRRLYSGGALGYCKGTSIVDTASVKTLHYGR
jgi:hypothetical protein